MSINVESNTEPLLLKNKKQKDMTSATSQWASSNSLPACMPLKDF